MKDQNFTIAFEVDQTPKEAFDAINNVRGWWTENVDGDTEKLNDEFSVKFWDVHYSKQKLTEVIPGKKVVWLITDSQLNFLQDKSEWTGTRIVFDLTEKDGKTEVRFTQLGLVPEIECYHECSNAWSGYINNSLRDLITTGNGNPTKRES